MVERVLYLKTTQFTDGHIVWKAWERDEGNDEKTVLWEFRRLLDCTHESFPRGCGQWLRKHEERVEKYLDVVGLDTETAFVPNVSSFVARDLPVPAHAKAEYQISSQGLVAILISFMTERTKPAHREAAAAVFRSLLWSCATEEQVLALGVGEVPLGDDDVDMVQCPMREHDDDHCFHWETLRVSTNREGDHRINYVHAVLAFREKAHECPCMTRALVKQMQKLADLFSERISEIGGVNPLEYPMNDLIIAGPKKKRRIDHDVQAAIVHNALQEGRARTPGQLARAYPELNESTVKSWVPRHMGCYKYALSSHFKSSSSITIAFDAGRFGSPKEETVTFAVTDNKTGCAGWLPPQASPCMKHQMSGMCSFFQVHRGKSSQNTRNPTPFRH
jgi:hypothetical protein